MTASLFIKPPRRGDRSHAGWWGAIASGTQKELDARPYELFEGPVKIDARFHLDRPDGRARDTHHQTTPDAFLLADALKGLGDGKLFSKATQVVELRVVKEYGLGYNTGIDIEVSEG